MKYILYARKSSEDKNKQVLSLESQISTMKKVAENLELKIVKIFSESKSAKKPDNRPMFSEMIKMIEAGKADGIICWKLDRLSRNPMDSGKIQWLLQQGIIKEIQTIEKRYLPEDNALIFNVEAGMANQYIRELVINVKRGQQTKLDRGGYPNYAPIGYKNNRLEKTIEPDAERARYVKRAFELYATGSVSLKALADKLYQEGFRSRGGYKYNKSKIHRILKNPIYYGVMFVHGKYYSGNHETIISKDLFDKVQEVINGKNRSRYKKHFYPLRGFMTCNVCGCLMTALEKKGFVYYYCTNGKGKCEEHKHYLKREKAEKLLSSIFQKIQFDKEFIELCYLADKEKNKTNENFFENMKANLEKRLKSLQEQELRLLDIQILGKYTQEATEAKLEALNKESADVRQQLKELEKQSPETAERTLEQIKKVFLEPYSLEKDFLEGNDEKKRQALQKLLLNAQIENRNLACFKLKQPYQALQKVEDKADFRQMRRGRDSNPGNP
ncbi:MAG: recombinase family protein [Candidatus Moranbacteria bacterium]|nr:recombinase family protein [Candidatus Moranbacteria bacterium]